jgi:copper chaperone CopZ
MGLRRFRLPTPPDEATAEEIRSEITELPGVGDVHVAPGEQDLAVETDDEVLADDEILAAIGRAGIEARLL